MAKKKSPNFNESSMTRKSPPIVKAKHKRKKLPPVAVKNPGWMVAGFDTSMSSLAGAAIAWDNTLKKFKGPGFVSIRWSKDDDYFDRLHEAVGSHLLVLSLQAELGISFPTDKVYIAQEEPWPLGMGGRKGGMSAFLKQQAEISGAFLGGLVRYGFKSIEQINSIRWRQMVAAIISDDTGEDVTTHHSKWKSPKLSQHYNCKPSDSGKFRTKQWALDCMAPFFAQWESEIPDWPDIIESSDGKKPRPESSHAKAVQPDDRYDALAVMWWLYLDLKEMGVIDK